jgi:hypothetical protein
LEILSRKGKIVLKAPQIAPAVQSLSKALKVITLID